MPVVSPASSWWVGRSSQGGAWALSALARRPDGAASAEPQDQGGPGRRLGRTSGGSGGGVSSTLPCGRAEGRVLKAPIHGPDAQGRRTGKKLFPPVGLERWVPVY